MTYEQFLQGKIDIAEESGFEIDPAEVNSALKPHQRDAVVWAIKGGRRAMFESFGLGKTAQQLEWARLISEKQGSRVLIIDDFLANGEALNALIDVVRQAGSELVGCGIVIEKAYQNGGNRLRESGVRVESLAAIKQMSENGIEFC